MHPEWALSSSLCASVTAGSEITCQNVDSAQRIVHAGHERFEWRGFARPHLAPRTLQVRVHWRGPSGAGVFELVLLLGFLSTGFPVLAAGFFAAGG